MRKHLIAALVLTATAFAATAVPAFTADNASVAVTVTAQPPAVPCVTFAGSPGTEVDFGTVPFSNPRDPLVGSASGNISPRFTNCGTATENLFIAGTDARNVCTGFCVVHTWRLGDARDECPTLNGYRLWYSVDSAGQGMIRTTIVPLKKLGVPGEPSDYGPGEAHDLALQIRMPCEGSDGAGEPFSLNVVLTAVVA